MRRCVAIVVLALLAAGCDDDTGGEEAAPTTADADTTTTVDETTTTPTTEPVPFDVEVKRAAIELLEIRNEVFQNPDVSRVSDYATSFCVCLEQERGIVSGLQEDGLRWSGPAVVPLGVVVSSPDNAEPVLTVVARQPETALIDASGGVVREVPEVELAPYSLTLVHEPALGWRLNSLDGVTLDRAIAEQIIDEGLP